MLQIQQTGLWQMISEVENEYASEWDLQLKTFNTYQNVVMYLTKAVKECDSYYTYIIILGPDCVFHKLCNMHL